MGSSLPTEDPLRGHDLSGTDFGGADLSERTFIECVFQGCNLRRADLRGAVFERCEFNDTSSESPADFNHAQLREARFTRCNLTVVEFCHAQAYDLVLENCQLQGADFSHADFRLPIGDTDLSAFTMRDCNCSFANLSNTFLAGCTLTGNRMIEACLDYCDLTDADLTNCELHNLSATGLCLAGADLRGSSFNNIDPRAIDLTGVTITPEQTPYLLDALGINLATE